MFDVLLLINRFSANKVGTYSNNNIVTWSIGRYFAVQGDKPCNRMAQIDAILMPKYLFDLASGDHLQGWY